MATVFKLGLCLVAILGLTGCANRPAGLNYEIPGKAVQSVELLDCDHESPPHCKKAKIHYIKGTEQVKVK